MDDDDEGSKFKDFLVEVKPVLDWFTLGLHLGVPIHELRTIEYQYPNQLQRQRTESLNYWYKNVESPSSCWRQLGEALLHVNGYEYVGMRILDKHCRGRHQPAPPMQASNPLIPPSSGCTFTGMNTSSNNNSPSAVPWGEPSGSRESHPSIPPHIVPRKPLGPLVSRGSGVIEDVPSITVVNPSTHHYTNTPLSHPPAIQNPSVPSSHSTVGIHGNTSLITPHTIEDGSVLSVSSDRFHNNRNYYGSIPRYGIPDHDNSHFTHNHHIQQGEHMVDVSNPNQSLSIDDAVSVSSSISSRPRPHPFAAARCMYDRNGIPQSIPQSNLMCFLPFHQSPNLVQSPSMQQRDPSQQIVPDSTSLAEDELKQFSFDFKDLVIDVRDALIEGNVKGVKLKNYLCDMVRGHGPEACHTLKTELSKTSREPTVREVFDVLLEFLNYDCYRLLSLVVDKFLRKSTVADRIAKYESDFKSFRQWCNLGPIADAHQRVYPSPSHHYSDTTLSLHLNDTWHQRTHSQLNGLLDWEFGSHVMQDSRMVHMSKHSILVVWETTYTVVNELCVNCVQRYSHLGSQGVLQLLIGRYQLDYTMDSSQPKLYQLQLRVVSAVNDDRMSSSTSAQSLYTHGSIRTGQVSQSTNDSGYDTVSSSSGAAKGSSGPSPPVKLPEYPLSDRALQKCPSKEIQKGYKSDSPNQLSVEKGELVTVTYEKDGWAEVVNNQKQRGFIPSSVMLKTTGSAVSGSHSDITELLVQPDARSTISSETQSTCLHTYDVILQEVIDSNQPPSCGEAFSRSDTEVVRPDTPPLVGTMNGLEISLSEDKNSMMAEEETMESRSFKKLPKQEKRRLKLNLIKDIETLSLTKSLRTDLNRLKHEDDEDLSPTLFQRLKSYFVRPSQRKDSASVSHRSRKISNISVTNSAYYTDTEERELPEEPLLLEESHNSVSHYV